ncbi:hypothetical protein BC629DRAFT_915231 [Irpex lacteus]|nr:hypothetical protein BC629DRAFT_915231 [Irpex lacteus]
MHPSLRLANAAATHRVHKPLINFLGKRKWPSTPEPQHPHPQAPADLQKSFSDFLSKLRRPDPPLPQHLSRVRVRAARRYLRSFGRLRSGIGSMSCRKLRLRLSRCVLFHCAYKTKPAERIV